MRNIVRILLFFFLSILSSPAWARMSISVVKLQFSLAVLAAILVLLFVWEIVEWVLKKKAGQDRHEPSGKVEVVVGEGVRGEEEDSFRALLREVKSLATSGEMPISPGRPTPSEEGAQAARAAEARVPEWRVEKKEVSKRPIPMEEIPETAVHLTVEGDTSVPAAPPGTGSWANLMKQAALEEEPAPPSGRTGIERGVSPPAPELPVSGEPARAAEEEDSWKALLRRTQAESEVDSSVQRSPGLHLPPTPKETIPVDQAAKGSPALAGSEGVREEEIAKIEEEILREVAPGQPPPGVASGVEQIAIPGIRLLSGFDKEEPGGETAPKDSPMSPRQEEVSSGSMRVLSLDTEEKKPAPGKMPPADDLPTFVKKASRIISLPDKEEIVPGRDEKETKIESPALLEESKDDKRFHALSDTLKKVQEGKSEEQEA